MPEQVFTDPITGRRVRLISDRDLTSEEIAAQLALTKDRVAKGVSDASMSLPGGGSIQAVIGGMSTPGGDEVPKTHKWTPQETEWAKRQLDLNDFQRGEREFRARAFKPSEPSSGTLMAHGLAALIPGLGAGAAAKALATANPVVRTLGTVGGGMAAGAAADAGRRAFVGAVDPGGLAADDMSQAELRARYPAAQVALSSIPSLLSAKPSGALDLGNRAVGGALSLAPELYQQYREGRFSPSAALAAFGSGAALNTPTRAGMGVSLAGEKAASAGGKMAFSGASRLAERAGRVDWDAVENQGLRLLGAKPSGVLMASPDGGLSLMLSGLAHIGAAKIARRGLVSFNDWAAAMKADPRIDAYPGARKFLNQNLAQLHKESTLLAQTGRSGAPVATPGEVPLLGGVVPKLSTFLDAAEKPVQAALLMGDSSRTLPSSRVARSGPNQGLNKYQRNMGGDLAWGSVNDSAGSAIDKAVSGLAPNAAGQKLGVVVVGSDTMHKTSGQVHNTIYSRIDAALKSGALTQEQADRLAQELGGAVGASVGSWREWMRRPDLLASVTAREAAAKVLTRRENSQLLRSLPDAANLAAALRAEQEPMLAVDPALGGSNRAGRGASILDMKGGGTFKAPRGVGNPWYPVEHPSDWLSTIPRQPDLLEYYAQQRNRNTSRGATARAMIGAPPVVPVGADIPDILNRFGALDDIGAIGKAYFSGAALPLAQGVGDAPAGAGSGAHLAPGGSGSPADAARPIAGMGASTSSPTGDPHTGSAPLDLPPLDRLGGAPLAGAPPPAAAAGAGQGAQGVPPALRSTQGQVGEGVSPAAAGHSGDLFSLSPSAYLMSAVPGAPPDPAILKALWGAATRRGDYGWLDRFRSPLSVIDGQGETITPGSYERIGGEAGKAASDILRSAQLEIEEGRSPGWALDQARKRLDPVFQRLERAMLPGLVEEIGAHVDALETDYWRMYSQRARDTKLTDDERELARRQVEALKSYPKPYEKAFGRTVEAVTGGKVLDPEFALRAAVERITSAHNILKLKYNIKSSAINLAQPLETLWPWITTSDYARIVAESLKPATRKRLIEAGVVDGGTKLEGPAPMVADRALAAELKNDPELADLAAYIEADLFLAKEEGRVPQDFATKPEGPRLQRVPKTTKEKLASASPFSAASEQNRMIGYLFGEMDARRKGMTDPIEIHRNGLAWAEMVEFDNSTFNTPPVMRDTVAKLALQYKGFTIKSLENLANLVTSAKTPQERAARLAKWGGQKAAVGGTKALAGPMGALGTAAYFTARQMFKDRGMSDQDAEKAAETIYLGLPALLGADVSGSVTSLDAPFGDTAQEQMVNFWGPTISGVAKQVQMGREGKPLLDRVGALTPLVKQGRGALSLLDQARGGTPEPIPVPRNEANPRGSRTPTLGESALSAFAVPLAQRTAAATEREDLKKIQGQIVDLAEQLANKASGRSLGQRELSLRRYKIENLIKRIKDREQAIRMRDDLAAKLKGASLSPVQ